MQNFTAAEMGMDTLRACHGRLAGSATAKIGHVPRVWEGLIDAGIPGQAIVPIALLELSCLALFLIPRTSVLGAFLLTGYLGGATLTHVVGGETLAPPLIVGLVVDGAVPSSSRLFAPEGLILVLALTMMIFRAVFISLRCATPEWFAHTTPAQVEPHSQPSVK